MSGLLPSSSEVETPEGEPRVIGVDDDDAERLLSALSSETARELFAAIHEQPATPSELADQVETSLQNAQYHLGKLEDAELIEVADTRYSEKGREMSVYAPTGAPIVLFAGSSDDSESVKTVLTNLLGGVGVLGLASLTVQRLFGTGIQAPTGGSGGTDGGDAGASAADATRTTTTESGAEIMAETTETQTEATRTMTTKATETAAEATTTVAQTTTSSDTSYMLDAGDQAAQGAGLPPGLVFFLGGLLVLCLMSVAWYYRQ